MALAEWTMVFLEIGFDGISIYEFGEFELQVVQKRGTPEEETEIGNEAETGTFCQCIQCG